MNYKMYIFAQNYMQIAIYLVQADKLICILPMIEVFGIGRHR